MCLHVTAIRTGSVWEVLIAAWIRVTMKNIWRRLLQESLKYKLRIPNQPYRYASLDASLYWHDLFAKETACRSRMTAIISTNFR